MSPRPYVTDWRAYVAAVVVTYVFAPAALLGAAWFSRWALAAGWGGM